MLHNVPHPSRVCTPHCVRARLSAQVAPARLRNASRARQRGTVFAAPVVYEAVVDPAQLVVLASTVGAGAFWWLVVVPSERASLAKVKRKGELREYLEDINADETRGLERWFYSNWLTAGWFKAASAKRRRAASQEPSVGGSEAPSVVPEEEYTDTDNQPVFLSLDNPLVFTSLLLGGLVLLAALKH